MLRMFTQTFASLTNGTSVKVRGYANGCYGEKHLEFIFLIVNQEVLVENKRFVLEIHLVF